MRVRHHRRLLKKEEDIIVYSFFCSLLSNLYSRYRFADCCRQMSTIVQDIHRSYNETNR